MKHAATRAAHQSAVVFDMDGVILDSEHAWETVMHELFAECGLAWSALDKDAFLGGDNSRQWAAYLRSVSGIPLEEDEILERVIRKLLEQFRKALPLMPGAREAVVRLAAEYPLALASSSPSEIIAFVLEQSGLERYFSAWTSSDDVSCGKPAPDVYLRACSLVGLEPSRCVAVEDSPSGIRAAVTAGLQVIVIPHSFFPLDSASLGLAALVLDSIDKLSVDAVESVLGR